MRQTGRACRWLAFGVALLAMGIAALWLARRPLTEAAIGSYLARNGVEARYRLTEATGRRLVFDDVSLGAAMRPDLAARRVTVDLAWLGPGPQVRAVRFDAPRLNVRVTRAGVSFGSLDRLIPPGRTDRFPAIALVIDGGIARVATPAGTVVARVDAQGRLDRDFRAVLRTAAAPLASGGCRGTAGPAAIAVTTRARDFAVAASGTIGDLACGGSAVARAGWSARLAAPLTLASLTGNMEARASSGTAGALRFAAPASLRLSASGSPAALHGPWQVAAGAVSAGHESARSMAAAGDFDWRRATGFAVAGRLAARGVASGTARDALNGRRLTGIAAALAGRAAAAARLIDIDARFAANSAAPSITVTGAELRGGGARLRFAGGDARWSPAQARIDGAIDLDGGGLPATHIVLAGVARSPAGWTGGGSMAVAPWRSGTGMIAVPGLRFALAGDRAVIDGRARLSTDFPGGRVDGLDLRLAAVAGLTGDGIAFGPGCADLAAGGARFAAVAISRISVRLCPRGLAVTAGRLAGGVAIGPAAFGGTAQGRVFAVASEAANLTVAGTPGQPDLRSDGLALRLRSGDLAGSVTVAGTVAGHPDGWTGAGRIFAAAADLPALAVRGGVARWRLAKGAVLLDSVEALFTDRAAKPRFAPLRLANAGGSASVGRITGHAAVGLAPGGAPLLTVSADYSPRTGTGSARVDSTLVFTKQLQPLTITELARGLVANVDGKVVSHADLVLGSGGVTGNASVRLDAVSLATASLGPVTGIDGTLVFDDLPRLHTAPHQQLKIASINPGVLVENGVARFAVIDAATVAIESMRWPFTGGTLTLQPVVLRAGETRRTFRLAVDGLDAGQFLQRFDLKNLNATGTFDGVLPLVFAGNTGRIEGGLLTARPVGGTIQYVGEVGQDRMGAAARLAFDALRRLRYRSLTLALDGDLDGELVTAVNFTGTNEQPVQLGGSLPIRSSGLPFKFAVTVRAPFRALLGTVASFSDARGILRNARSAPEPKP